MFIHLVIHHPKQGKEAPLIDSMHLMAQAVQGDPFDEWEDEDPEVYLLQTV